MSEEEEQDFDKILGQFRLALNGIMSPLRKYGQGHYVDGVSEEIVSLAYQLHLKLYGVDIPYYHNDIHW